MIAYNRTIQLNSSDYVFDESTLHLFEPRSFEFRKAAPLVNVSHLSSVSSSSSSSSSSGMSGGYPTTPIGKLRHVSSSPYTPGISTTPSSSHSRLHVDASVKAECRSLAQSPHGVLAVVWGSGAMTLDVCTLSGSGGLSSRW